MSFVLSPMAEETPACLRKYGYERSFFAGRPGLTLERVQELLERPSVSVGRNAKGRFEVKADGTRIVTRGLTASLSTTIQASKYSKNIKNPKSRMTIYTCQKYNSRLSSIMDASKNKPETFLVLSHALIKTIMPCTRKASDAFSLELFHSKRKTYNQVRTLWNKHRLQLQAGVELDADVKTAAFDVDSAKYPYSLNVLECLTLSGFKVVAADVPVTSHKGEGLNLHCLQCKKSCDPSLQMSTEVDLVCYHAATRKVVLVELKSSGNGRVCPKASKAYRVQGWLTWLMFANTYPKLAPYTDSCILLYSFAERQLKSYRVVPCAMASGYTSAFGFLNNWCPAKAAVMCPVGVKYRLSNEVMTEKATRSDRDAVTDTVQRCTVLPPYHLLNSFIVAGGTEADKTGEEL